MYTVKHLIDNGAKINIKDKIGVSVTMVHRLALLLGVCVMSYLHSMLLFIRDQFLMLSEGPLSYAPYKINYSVVH